ncbi:hypothetical protein ACFVXH_39650 [Kitasatospora sp. NPDC058184]|uniref:hypothetical protein n=1 Tax=Kitasatospora sp. NPDC058184 TaxID=3346370 RepID=UPI0036DA8F5B
MTPTDPAHAQTPNLLGSDPGLPPEPRVPVAVPRERADTSHTPAHPPLTTRIRTRIRAHFLARRSPRLRLGRVEITLDSYAVTIEQLPKPGCNTCGDHRGWWYGEGEWEFCDCALGLFWRRIPWRPGPARSYSAEPPF